MVIGYFILRKLAEDKDMSPVIFFDSFLRAGL